MNPGPATKSTEALLLYDGLCGVCNSAVQWVLKHDHADRFRFAPQQSQLATEILGRHQVDRAAMLAANSVYLALHPGSPEETLLTQSDVTIYILLSIGGIWKIPGNLLRVLPRLIRDGAYRLFARNRYRFSRKYATCPLPAAAVRAKFLA